MSLAATIMNNNNNNSNNNTTCFNEPTLESTPVIDDHRRQIIKRKVLAIGKMSRSYSVLKEHPELVEQLKTLSANGKLPLGTLATGEQGIREGKIKQIKTNK
jgi:hypothetical protein